MSRIFLSHSSGNNAEAIALSDWLVDHGWDDLFLDLDPERGLKAGEKWQAALKQAAERCELVIFLISPQWAGSKWCLAEFLLAKNLNKRIFGVIVEPTPFADIPSEMTTEWQLVDLTAGTRDYRATVRPPPGDKTATVAFAENALDGLRIGLMKAGLDARYFPWPPETDPDRAPYRGLLPLEADDAGIFFGRDGPMVVGLDLLRRLRDAAPPRLLVILGASGGGKSSFLRAGLLPRLDRESQHFLSLPVVRPERAVLTNESWGLVASLEKALREAKLGHTRAEIRKAVESGVGGVESLLTELVNANAAFHSDDGTKARKPPTLVLAIDQAEELFHAEGAGEAHVFLTLLRELVTRDRPALIALFTIRSDSYERLQEAKQLDGVRKIPFDLSPMPKGAYAEVIKGPARRLEDTKRPLKIEETLVDALLSDIEGGGAKDALPLLAFTLERLYLEEGGDGDLTLLEYEELGRVKGSIEAAVERALKVADADPKIPHDREARLALLRRGLIPWLAGIDPEAGTPRRRIARHSEIPPESRRLIDLLVEQRLLSTDIAKETGEATVEPAHEALLRQWGLLQGWLTEDAGLLGVLEGVKRAARDWAANAKDDTWLAHGGGRLDDTDSLKVREDLAASLDATDRAYLDACRVADTARRNRELEEAKKLAEANRKVALRTTVGLIAASILALLAAGLAVFGLNKAREADERATEALKNESVAFAGYSAKALGEGRAVDAVKLALAAWPRTQNSGRPELRLTLESLADALPQLRERLRVERHADVIWSTAFSPDGTRVATGSWDKTARLWDAVTGDQIAELKGHQDRVNSVAFSPDGTRVVTASSDKTARIWDGATGTVIAVLNGHEKRVGAAAFSPNGASVVTASNDNTGRLWNTATGAENAVLKGHEGSVNSAAFSPDGTRVVTTSADNTARVWDAATGVQITELKGHQEAVYSAVFSPDGTRVLTASWDKTARLWDAVTGDQIAALEGHEGKVNTAAFSPDGTWVVTASDDRTARLWNGSTGKIEVLKGHQNWVNSAAFSRDGTRVVTTSDDNTARLWDVDTGTEIAVLKGHEGKVKSAAFSPDGTRVATSSYDKTARVWDVSTGAEIAVLKGHENWVNSAVFSPDATRVVTASWDKTARLWDAATGVEKTVLRGHEIGVNSAVFSPDGTRVLTASSDKTARLWDAETGAEIAVLKGHGGRVNSAAFSPDGTRVVTASDDKTARVWAAATGEQIAALRGHEKWVNSAAFSPDGTQVVTTSDDNTARVWNASTGVQIAELKGHEFGVSSAVFSPDGRRVMTANSGGFAPDGVKLQTEDDGAKLQTDKAVRLWDVAKGTEIAVLKGHAKGINSAAFSPDGTLVVTASDDRTARVWDASTGAEIAVLRGHEHSVKFADFSPDGTRVLTASSDRTARLWDVATGAEIAVLKGSQAPIHSATFSRDGTRVVTSSYDNTARVWDTTKQEKGDGFAVACARLGKNTDLAGVHTRYGLGGIAPICGDHWPLPVDRHQIK